MQLCSGLYNSVKGPNLWRYSKCVLHLFWSESESDINNKTASHTRNDSVWEFIVVIYQCYGDEAINTSVWKWKGKKKKQRWLGVLVTRVSRLWSRAVRIQSVRNRKWLIQRSDEVQNIFWIEMENSRHVSAEFRGDPPLNFLKLTCRHLCSFLKNVILFLLLFCCYIEDLYPKKRQKHSSTRNIQK